MFKKLRIILSSVCLLFFGAQVFAQETVSVPDVTGMSVPQAAALLNRSGLLLGAENNEGWTIASAFPQNTIGAQSIPTGQSVPRGTAVDVSVLRSPNIVLLYDDNDLTLVNQSQGTLDLNGVRFNSENGAASFLASRWGGALETGDCGQVWSIARREPKRLPECGSTLWLTTNNPQEHFWTGAGGVTRFTVSQNGVPRAVCEVANPGRCEFYLATGGAGGDVTPFVYFAYTPDRLIVFNRSADQWMPLAQLHVYNQNYIDPNQPLTIGDPTLFAGQNPLIIGDVTRLAPGQCLFFTNGSPTRETPPQPCDVIARLNISASVIFWSKSFDLDSVTDGQRRTCPAAVEGKLTICVMPR